MECGVSRTTDIGLRGYKRLCSCIVVVIQGHALYYGRAQLADDYFQKMGYHLPYRVNVADFILDLASGDFSVDDRQAPALTDSSLPLRAYPSYCALHARLSSG